MTFSYTALTHSLTRPHALFPYLMPLIVRSAPIHERRSIKERTRAVSLIRYGNTAHWAEYRPHDQTPYPPRPGRSNPRYTNTLDCPDLPRNIPHP